MNDNNAATLEQELDWFYRVMDTRIKLHFGHDCRYSDIDEVSPPDLDMSQSVYAQFVGHYEMDFFERLLLLLSLIPHIRPQLLDVFFTKNADNARDFTEFGGRNSHSFQGFLPTGETAMFLLAGSSLAQRLRCYDLFGADHFFHCHKILELQNSGDNDPRLNGFLALSDDVRELLMTGHINKPVFSADFPAKAVETDLQWSDLILDTVTMEQVLEIKTWIDYENVLLDELDMRRTIKPGYRSLFCGPSGTGKTLTATLLGKMTGREVYKVDLSMVISKYIGETEKNLERVFEKAENKNWILFFDEADALFGKRTAVSDAHDRFANQEVSYLLQRVEGYAGVVILASNFRSNLDAAFTRRFQSIIHFPVPKQTERLILWQQAFPEKMGFSGDVNLADIAADHELAGGSIINVVRHAVLAALKKENRAIELSDIRNGIRRELQKSGKSG
ncbi:MAG: ATP-binding protein [Mariprofundus sp.]|nr:ATP-binding protein [Mariprofundus sp.]